MKAVVLEIRKNEAAVLCKDGRIIRIPEKNFAVGDEIEISVSIEKDSRRVRTLRRIRQSCAAAAAVAVILGLGGNHWYQTAVACSYVSLDINPSIEYTLNRQNCVLDVTAVNDDAEEIVSELKEAGIRKCTLTEALEKTAGLLEEKGYLTSGETDYVLIDVSSDDKAKAKSLKKEASGVFAEMNEKEDAAVEVTVTQSSVSQREEAKKLGISSGEYQQIRTIEGQDDTQKTPLDQATVESYRDWNVRDFLDATGALPQEKNPSGATTQRNGSSGTTTQEKNSSGTAAQPENTSGQKSQSSTEESGNASSSKVQSDTAASGQNPQNDAADITRSSNDMQSYSGSQESRQNRSNVPQDDQNIVQDNTSDMAQDNASDMTQDSTPDMAQDNAPDTVQNNVPDTVQDGAAR